LLLCFIALAMSAQALAFQWVRAYGPASHESTPSQSVASGLPAAKPIGQGGDSSPSAVDKCSSADRSGSHGKPEPSCHGSVACCEATAVASGLWTVTPPSGGLVYSMAPTSVSALFLTEGQERPPRASAAQ
jgi:hypothetical protein